MSTTTSWHWTLTMLTSYISHRSHLYSLFRKRARIYLVIVNETYLRPLVLSIDEHLELDISNMGLEMRLQNISIFNDHTCVTRLHYVLIWLCINGCILYHFVNYICLGYTMELFMFAQLLLYLDALAWSDSAFVLIDLLRSLTTMNTLFSNVSRCLLPLKKCAHGLQVLTRNICDVQ